MTTTYKIKFCFDCGQPVEPDAIECENCGAQENAQQQWIVGTFNYNPSGILGVSAEIVEEGTVNEVKE